MTAAAGTLLLAVTAVAATVATVLWVRVARGRDEVASARLAGILVLVGAVGAVAAMEVALLGNDFSVDYVAGHSSAATPPAYRFSALWGGLDGSLLLWLLVLSGFAVLVGAGRAAPRSGTRHDVRALHAVASAVTAGVTAAFAVLTFVGARPFDRLLPAPADGAGPNPLLVDHPAMLVHPPLLYVGYAGLVVPFAYAVAALMTRSPAAAWLPTVRTWSVVAWVSLTAGITLGAWWSYAVLGWGGYWAWDPVENASLIPWLCTTALLHVLMAHRHRPSLGPWVAGLAGAGFLLVVTGTFLTRSGVVASVHSFTPSALGPLLLGLLAVGVAGVAGLVVWRGEGLASPTGPGSGEGGAPPARESLLVAGAALVGGLGLTVLLGTVAPALLRGIGVGEVSVGRPFYDRIAVPVGLALLVLMVLGPLARWRHDRAASLLARATLPGLVGTGTICLLGFAGASGVLPVLTIGLAAAVLGQSIQALVRGRRSRLTGRAGAGGRLAHAGFALVVVGVAASSAWSTTAEATLGTGRSVEVGASTVRLDGVDRHGDGRRMSTAARLSVLVDGRSEPLDTAALVFYPGRDVTVPTPAIASSPAGDLYVTLLAVDPDQGTATLRVTLEPLVGLLWAGGAVMALGGILVALPGRRRRPAPVTTEVAPAPVAAREG